LVGFNPSLSPRREGIGSLGAVEIGHDAFTLIGKLSVGGFWYLPT
jgi:hypothetical protein